ncbi:hypothetical protein AB0H34_43390 [Saccharopolyspora shandongensis]
MFFEVIGVLDVCIDESQKSLGIVSGGAGEIQVDVPAPEGFV